MIYITGDTHGEQARLSYLERRYALGSGDFLVVCGDFGFVGGEPEKQAYLDLLAQKPWTLAFIDGNHEDFPQLASYPVEQWQGGNIHRIRKNILHLMRGQVFTIQEKRFFTMGGAFSVDWLNRTPGKDWWPEELPSAAEYEEARNSLRAAGNRVDCILTHTAPASLVWRIARRLHFPVTDREAELNRFLEEVRQNVQFSHWYFGHFHDDWEIDEKFTLLFQSVKTV